MNAASGGALTLPRSNAPVLDLCMAPGGYTASVLKHSPDAAVCAFTLPLKLGGHEVMVRKDASIELKYGDITMLHKEFGVEDLPPDHCELSKFSDERPWLGKWFDLVFCDGQALRTHEPYRADYRQQVEAARLSLSQQILAMQRIESGGTLIMLLHKLAAYRTVKLLHLFDKFAQVQLFKPTSSHKIRGTFYLIAKHVQPGHPEAVAAVNEWKRVWKKLTFPTLDQDGQVKPPDAAKESELTQEVSDLLAVFGERIIELGEPVWQIQKAALATKNWRTWKPKKQWTKKPKTHPWTEEVRTAGEASTAATGDTAIAAPHHSEEDAYDMGDPDHVDPADLTEVSAAVARLGVGN